MLLCYVACGMHCCLLSWLQRDVTSHRLGELSCHPHCQRTHSSSDVVGEGKEVTRRKWTEAKKVGDMEESNNMGSMRSIWLLRMPPSTPPSSPPHNL